MRLLSVALLLAAVPAAAAPPVTDAQIIRVGQPDQQLAFMLAATFFQDPAGASTFYALGIAPGCRLLQQAVGTAVVANRAAWTSNLVAAFRAAVPADTLATIVAKPAGEIAPLVDPLRPAIGKRMQAASEPILASAAAGVMKTMNEAALKVDVAKVDRAGRDAELQAAQATGAQFCGLLPPEMTQRPPADAPPPPPPPR